MCADCHHTAKRGYPSMARALIVPWPTAWFLNVTGPVQDFKFKHRSTEIQKLKNPKREKAFVESWKMSDWASSLVGFGKSNQPMGQSRSHVESSRVML